MTVNKETKGPKHDDKYRLSLHMREGGFDNILSFQPISQKKCPWQLYFCRIKINNRLIISYNDPFLV